MEVTFTALNMALEDRVSRLLKAGLEARWGEYDASFNPDIAHLFEYYGPRMMVGIVHSDVVCCGGWIDKGSRVAQLVRFSVDPRFQRQSIGSNMLITVEDRLRSLDYEEAVLETTSSWESAVRFYLGNGYVLTHQEDGDSHFRKVLTEPSCLPTAG